MPNRTQRNVGWILAYNHIDQKVMGNPDTPELLEKFPVTFTLYDDDGTLYLMGRMTKDLEDSCDILSPLDYAQDVWGCTEMVINGKTI